MFDDDAHPLALAPPACTWLTRRYRIAPDGPDVDDEGNEAATEDHEWTPDDAA